MHPINLWSVVPSASTGKAFLAESFPAESSGLGGSSRCIHGNRAPAHLTRLFCCPVTTTLFFVEPSLSTIESLCDLDSLATVSDPQPMPENRGEHLSSRPRL